MNAQSGGGHALEPEALKKHAMSQVHFADVVKARQRVRAAEHTRQPTMSQLAVRATDEAAMISDQGHYTVVMAGGWTAPSIPTRSCASLRRR